MTKTRTRWLSLAGLAAFLASGAIACGGETEVTTTGRCAGVPCPSSQSCDPADGICKCGGPGGLVCKSGEECALEPEARCFSPLCQFTRCERGESCDRETGECSCGGVSCKDDEVCVDGLCKAAESCVEAQCGAGLECDPVDGKCKCFGVECAAGESCVEGECASDRCAGVNCATNATCNAADGTCHCGGITGPICQTGQACMKVGEGFDCVTSDLCDEVECRGGTTCDPTDGKCHCGGVGDLAPVCNSEQTCIAGECRGGGLCPPVGEPSNCSADTSCDPADGLCKCGGAGGILCEANESCTFLSGSFTCATRCDIFGSPTGCEAGEGCYYDGRRPIAGNFCATAGNTPINGSCSNANDCQPGHYCNPSTNTCRRLCKPSQGGSACAGVGGAAACAPITGGPEDLGFCISE